MRKMTSDEFSALVDADLLPARVMELLAIAVATEKKMKLEAQLKAAFEVDKAAATEYVNTRHFGVYL